MIDDTLVLESVNERDIDLLLVEELNVNTSFTHWFVSKGINKASSVSKLFRVQRSVSNSYGETDILISFETCTGCAVVLLVENKISAPPQPNQAARYRLRGEAGMKTNEWNEHHSCIIAPAKYLENSRNTDGYMNQISYEEIRDWFAACSTDLARGRYRASIIDEAINQNRRGYVPLIDGHASKFWNQYWRLATEEFPELRLSEPNARPAGSVWMQFSHAQLPEGCRLQHKADRGAVHLELRGRASEFDSFANAKEETIPEDIEIVLASKSLALSINVPPLNHADNFESQEENVRDGLRAARRLMSFANSSDGLALLLK